MTRYTAKKGICEEKQQITFDEVKQDYLKFPKINHYHQGWQEELKNPVEEKKLDK